MERSSPILCRDERIYRRFTAQAENLLDVRGVMRNQGGSPFFKLALVLVPLDTFPAFSKLLSKDIKRDDEVFRRGEF